MFNGGNIGRPGTRVSEQTGGPRNELTLPLQHALVIALLVCGAALTLALEMALIGRGLLLVVAVALLGYGLWRVALLLSDWLEGAALAWSRVALAVVGAVLLWAWLQYGQPTLERLWWPIWYGPPMDGFAPVQFGNDPLNMRLMPGWLFIVRALLVPTVAVAYALPAWLILQRFGMEIVLPQLLAVTPQQVRVATHVPRFVTTIEQQDDEPQKTAKAGPPIYVQVSDAPAPDADRLEQRARHTRAVQLEDLEPAQWEIIASRAASNLPWSEADVGRGKVLTTPQFRAVTQQLASLGYLRLRVPTNPRSGYEWTPAGLRFLERRWWERLG